MPSYQDIHRKLRKCLQIYIADVGERGVGIFAACPFHAGEIVVIDDDGDFYNDLLTFEDCVRSGYDMYHCFQVGIDSYVLPNGNIDDFINHSCDPNCGMRLTEKGYVKLALRDIEIHEELTYDYSTYSNAPHPPIDCLCGADSCRGVIGNFATLPESLQQRYLALGIVGSYVMEPLPEPNIRPIELRPRVQSTNP